MTLNAEHLTEIENLASYFFSPEEIAIVLDLDIDDLTDELTDDETSAYKAYQRGKLKSKLELRKSILTLAKQGSGPAQSLAVKMLEESNLD